MKAEEDEVDIDNVISAHISTAGPSTTSATSVHANRSAGPGTGVVTPILTITNSDSSGNGHAAQAVDGVLGKLGSNFGDLGVNIDLDDAWAEEEPDDDDPGVWRMKVVMENEESVGYY
jgi:hypothetical protein